VRSHGRYGDVRRQDRTNGKTVTLTGASLTGADAGNYILDSVADHANITIAAHHRQLHGEQQDL